jgi:hypothetical protein
MFEKITLPGMSSTIAIPGHLPVETTRRQIVDFLDGHSDGSELMMALYGDLVDEPLPPRLARLVDHWRRRD